MYAPAADGVDPVLNDKGEVIRMHGEDEGTEVETETEPDGTTTTTTNPDGGDEADGGADED